MSKCRPKATDRMFSLASHGVVLRDVTEITRDRAMVESAVRNVIISIPYNSLRDNKEVQIAFQDLLTISTSE